MIRLRVCLMTISRVLLELLLIITLMIMMPHQRVSKAPAPRGYGTTTIGVVTPMARPWLGEAPMIEALNCT